MKLDLAVVKTKEELMEWIQESFGFPQFFGKNWDAVEECLRDSCHSDVQIDVVNEDKANEEMKKEMAMFREVIAAFNQEGKAQINFSTN